MRDAEKQFSIIRTCSGRSGPAAVCNGCTGFAANSTSDYAVVASKKTLADSDWKKVAQALVKKHNATVVTFDADVNETVPELRRQFPRY